MCIYRTMQKNHVTKTDKAIDGSCKEIHLVSGDVLEFTGRVKIPRSPRQRAGEIFWLRDGKSANIE